MAKKILLADDSLTIQKVVELTFSDNDYDLVCVGNGQKALERVWQDHPDLILADVVMPEKNGYEVCEVIKSNPSTARIPVILLSGTFEPFDRERAERIGCDAIVSKPFDSQQLLAQVEALLARTASAVPEATPEPVATGRHAPRASSDNEEPFETGFEADDFTASGRPPREAYRSDPFEEEFGRGDVDSAVAAFETERSFAPESERTAEIRLSSEESGRETPWLVEEQEPLSAQESGRGAPRPSAGLWGEGASGEESTEALRFESDTTEEPLLSGSSGLRADEAPTSEIRMDLARDGSIEEGGEQASIPLDATAGSGAPPEDISAFDAEILFDVESQASTGSDVQDTFDEAAGREGPSASLPEESGEGLDDFEESALRDTAEARDAEPSAEAPPGKDPGGEDEIPAGAADPATELEALAQNVSIPELTKMLSSVPRADGGLSEADLDRLASRVVEKLSERIVREIAWEVIPDMAEVVIKKRIKELEAGVE